MPKYPNINVELVGQDGNAFFILGKVVQAMRKGKADPKDITDFQTKAMSGDYDNLLRTVSEYVNITGQEDDSDDVCDTCGCKNCQPDED